MIIIIIGNERHVQHSVHQAQLLLFSKEVMSAVSYSKEKIVPQFWTKVQREDCDLL